jgi:phosphonate transport system permease protein
MAPVVLRDTVFRFELNLRESLILGIVGAGGIGLYVQTYVRSFQYDKAATVTLAIIALVLLFEGLNSVLQKRFS